MESQVLSNENSGAKCFIEANGQVNCSTAIYEDEKRWKKSRSQVDLLIQALKNKIFELKDIRRHLKENKPKNMTDEYDLDSNENVPHNSSSEEMVVNNTPLSFDDVSRPSKRPNHFQKWPHRAQKQGSSATVDEQSLNESNTKNYSLALSPTSVAPSLKSVLVNQPDSVTSRNITVDDEHSTKHHQSDRGNDHIRHKSTTMKLPKHSAPMTTRPSTSKLKTTKLSIESITSTAQSSTQPIKSVDNVSASSSSDASPDSTRSIDTESDHTMDPLQKYNDKIASTTTDTPRTECFCEPDTHDG